MILKNKQFEEYSKIVCDKVDIEEGEAIGAKLLQELSNSKYGVGLAAPQIGITKRVCVINVNEPLVLINPEIIEWSEESTYIKEGCLSFPGLFVAIERAYGVSTRFQLSSGEEQSGNFINISAKIFQHESEHMDGEIFIDNVSGFKLKAAMRKRNIYLRKLKRQKKD